MGWPTVIIASLSLLGMSFIALKRIRAKRLVYIKKFHFHSSIKNKILKKYPFLSDEQISLVFQALRDYFYICNQAKRSMVAMPSQVVDDAWHEFILHTRVYKDFSQKALGRFLHHTPTEAMRSPTLAQEGIKRTWRLACAKEKINPVSPNKLPLIFGIDAMLNIPNGFVYTLNCRAPNSPAYGSGYCAGDIGCTSGCSGSSGSGSESGGFFDGMSDSSDGGSSCGSGCGGGD
ncbi:glycine-rich domain-containing protein [Sulfurirhabdus autotrophica]|uniref:Uncharacterized protein n=1 Tax=Sulfurirhabdus autotrophica TaxID=1706046 RepID=A0A4R3XT32_9PROT|nr:hypothetical protein [Sulfurirhabdus autotrophica]TCV82336.1 hypothetical protein EDC63_12228 [Sulfurirhabdus autotrophica]